MEQRINELINELQSKGQALTVTNVINASLFSTGGTVTDREAIAAQLANVSKVIRFKKIEDLKKGEFFKRTETAKKVFVKDGYNRSIKRYQAHEFEDVNSFIGLPKGKLVFIDFEF